MQLSSGGVVSDEILFQLFDQVIHSNKVFTQGYVVDDFPISCIPLLSTIHPSLLPTHIFNFSKISFDDVNLRIGNSVVDTKTGETIHLTGVTDYINWEEIFSSPRTPEEYNLIHENPAHSF